MWGGRGREEERGEREGERGGRERKREGRGEGERGRERREGGEIEREEEREGEGLLIHRHVGIATVSENLDGARCTVPSYDITHV